MIQVFINQGQPERAYDVSFIQFFAYHKKLMFYPSNMIINVYLKALYDNENWELIKESFKRVKDSNTAKKDFRTYLMAIRAYRELKDWKKAYKLHLHAEANHVELPKEFWNAIRDMHEGLTEEESKKFISIPRIEKKLQSLGA